MPEVRSPRIQVRVVHDAWTCRFVDERCAARKAHTPHDVIGCADNSIIVVIARQIGLEAAERDLSRGNRYQKTVLEPWT